MVSNLVAAGMNTHIILILPYHALFNKSMCCLLATEDTGLFAHQQLKAIHL